MRTRSGLIHCALLGVVVLAGCRITPKVQFPDPVIETTLSQKFAERHPIDFAVLPVYSVPEEIPPMARALRERVKRELLDKRYSPVSFRSIDDKLGAFPERRRFDLNQIRGNFDEDALLHTRLERWDHSHLRSDLTVVISVAFTLYDSRTGEVLWSYTVRDRPVRVPSISPEGTGAGGYEEYVADVIVRDAFQGFPPKDRPPEPPE